MVSVTKISSLFLDIFFPKKCLSCGKYGDFLCFECARKIEKIETKICPICGKISEMGRFCKSCKGGKNRILLDGVLAAAKYEKGPLKELIYYFKYHGFTGLAEHLGELICGQLKELKINENWVVVPVPLHIKRKNLRGYNQSELLARYISRQLSLSGGAALARIKNTIPQASLQKTARLTNLAGAFIMSL